MSETNGSADTLVFIPAFDEEDSIAGVIEGVRANIPGATVLVVDDGSGDGTARSARAAGALVAPLPVNQGLGAALQTGYLFGLRHGFAYFAHLDGDGQHPPAEVVRLLAEVEADRADLVIGSRYRDPAMAEANDYRPSRVRRIGTDLFKYVLSVATRQRFTDTTSGMRAGNRRAMELFAEDYSPDFAEIESLQRAVRAGMRVEEVPVRMLPRETGESFLSPVKSAFFIFKSLVVILVGMFRPRHPDGQGDGR